MFLLAGSIILQSNLIPHVYDEGSSLTLLAFGSDWSTHSFFNNFSTNTQAESCACRIHLTMFLQLRKIEE